MDTLLVDAEWCLRLQKELIELRDKVYDLNIEKTQLKNKHKKLEAFVEKITCNYCGK